MNVWITFNRYGDEETSVSGVFDSKEKAESFVKSQEKVIGYHLIDDIEEWSVR